MNVCMCVLHGVIHGGIYFFTLGNESMRSIPQGIGAVILALNSVKDTDLEGRKSDFSLCFLSLYTG